MFRVASLVAHYSFPTLFERNAIPRLIVYAIKYARFLYEFPATAYLATPPRGTDSLIRETAIGNRFSTRKRVVREPTEPRIAFHDAFRWISIRSAFPKGASKKPDVILVIFAPTAVLASTGYAKQRILDRERVLIYLAIEYFERERVGNFVDFAIAERAPRSMELREEF